MTDLTEKAVYEMVMQFVGQPLMAHPRWMEVAPHGARHLEWLRCERHKWVDCDWRRVKREFRRFMRAKG